MPEPCLIDTNILLRLRKRDDPKHSAVRSAVVQLNLDNAALYYTSQTVAEFWNVSTRPMVHKGFGLTIAETDNDLRAVESEFTLLRDHEAIFVEWRKLVVAHEVRGVKVYDARIVASMRVYGIRRILTFNAADFRRYPDIEVIVPEMHPKQA